MGCKICMFDFLRVCEATSRQLLAQAQAILTGKMTYTHCVHRQRAPGQRLRTAGQRLRTRPAGQRPRTTSQRLSTGPAGQRPRRGAAGQRLRPEAVGHRLRTAGQRLRAGAASQEQPASAQGQHAPDEHLCVQSGFWIFIFSPTPNPDTSAGHFSRTL